LQLNTYFEKFVSNIQPSEERISAASEAHTTLRDHLEGVEALSCAASDSFLSGSYGRHTAVSPIKDVDVILIIDCGDLSDDHKTPSPKVVLQNLRDVIDDFYDEVDLETQRRSIRVDLPEDDIQMDIVPAIAPNGKDKKLFVPDHGQGKWIESHPTAHLNFATQTNKGSKGHFVRVAKAMKWWKSRNLDKETAPKSFLLEVIVANNIKSGGASLCETFELTLSNMVAKYKQDYDKQRLPKVTDPGLPESDLVSTCGLTQAGFNAFYEALQGLSDLATKANSDETSRADTIVLWQSAFGNVYPESLKPDEEERLQKSLSDVAAATPRHEFPYSVKISARLAREKNGPVGEYYPATKGRKLPKNYWLRFRLEQTDAPLPYAIKWAVRNHGADARKDANGLYHETFPGQVEHWESTKYRGHHFMDCELWKDGRVIARTRHTINIS
jgi:hypothetical protein